MGQAGDANSDSLRSATLPHFLSCDFLCLSHSLLTYALQFTLCQSLVDCSAIHILVHFAHLLMDDQRNGSSSGPISKETVCVPSAALAASLAYEPIEEAHRRRHANLLERGAAAAESTDGGLISHPCQLGSTVDLLHCHIHVLLHPAGVHPDLSSHCGIVRKDSGGISLLVGRIPIELVIQSGLPSVHCTTSHIGDVKPSVR